MTDAATAAGAGLGFPNESAAYREARDALLAAEIELRRRLEAVGGHAARAAARRRGARGLRVRSG
ncbi:MAG TPA: hypothetical protein VN805_13425 [Caulobacteraceae bacterium]|nr:hypothetical protein [Caulobacteraceae bacterium]